MGRRETVWLTSAALAVGAMSPTLAQQQMATREARGAPAVEPQPATRPAPPKVRPSLPSQPERPTTRPTPGYERPVTRPRPDRPTPLPGPRPPEGGWHWDRPTPPPGDWGGWGGSGGWGGNWQNWGGDYRRLTCESRNGRYQRCPADTQGRAGVIRTLSSTRCTQGYSWGYNRSHIWVSNGCRAEFAYGYGGSGGWDDDRRDRDRTARQVIGGVAVAGSLIALIAAANSAKAPPPGTAAPPTPVPEAPAGLPYQPHSGPARISADYGALPSAAQAPARTCMAEAAQQIGATGGSTLTWVRTLQSEPGNGGYRFNVALRADYPDGARDLAMYCRATPEKVVQLDFAALSG